MLDPHRRLFAHRLYRGACLRVPSPGDARLALLLKDLGRLGRDLARTVLIDNTPAVRGDGTCCGRLCTRLVLSIVLCMTQRGRLPTVCIINTLAMEVTICLPCDLC